MLFEMLDQFPADKEMSSLIQEYNKLGRQTAVDIEMKFVDKEHKNAHLDRQIMAMFEVGFKILSKLSDLEKLQNGKEWIDKNEVKIYKFAINLQSWLLSPPDAGQEIGAAASSSTAIPTTTLPVDAAASSSTAIPTTSFQLTSQSIFAHSNVPRDFRQTMAKNLDSLCDYVRGFSLTICREVSNSMEHDSTSDTQSRITAIEKFLQDSAITGENRTLLTLALKLEKERLSEEELLLRKCGNNPPQPQ